MKMKIPGCTILSILLTMFLFGCATPVRYTYDEIKDYPLHIQENIMKGEAAVGMTTKQVRYAWGPPASVKMLEPLDGKQREEWTYTTLGVYKTRILIFIDGKLVYITGEPQKQ